MVLAHIEDVERMIAAYDEIRREHRLDLIDTAILIARHAFPSDNPSASASGISGMIVEAYWHWDKERYGEDRAWRLQRSRGEFEGQVAGRLGQVDA